MPHPTVLRLKKHLELLTHCKYILKTTKLEPFTWSRLKAVKQLKTV